jgi:hypothetical protein
MNTSGKDVTIVLVHGAWADGSSWNNVMQPLQAQNLAVIAAPLPLTSLREDVQALERVLERTSGPVVPGAHAYAGAVISAVANERVLGPVFIAALTPDAGETVADVFYREKPHPQAPQLAPDAHGLNWMPQEGFRAAFAQKSEPACLRRLSAPSHWRASRRRRAMRAGSAHLPGI